MARLELNLLGPYQAALDGQPITTFESVKVGALLAFLAAHQDQAEQAARLFGSRWRRGYRHCLSPIESERHEAALAAIRESLGQERFETLYNDRKLCAPCVPRGKGFS
jgi:hypothetical protein